MDIRNLPRYMFRDEREPGNVGDLIGPMLLHKMFGYANGFPVITHYADGFSPKLITVGSVLGMAYRPGDFVWGAGIIESETTMEVDQPERILALRGPRTHRRMRGLDRDVPYGDPGLLCSLYWETPSKPRKYIGLLPHWIDRPHMAKLGMGPTGAAMIDIDITLPLERIVAKLAECHTVIATSLHGIVLAEAYQVPTVIWEDSWSGEVTGGRFKFYDYFMGTDRHVNGPGLIPRLDAYELVLIQRRLTMALTSAID